MCTYVYREAAGLACEIVRGIACLLLLPAAAALEIFNYGGHHCRRRRCLEPIVISSIDRAQTALDSGEGMRCARTTGGEGEREESAENFRNPRLAPALR